VRWFFEMSPNERPCARVSAASRAELERWLDAILTAERLNDLFG
jgi:hypothetical protein